MQRSGYHPVANGLGVVLPAHGMRLSPARISRWIDSNRSYAADQIAIAMKVKRCDRLLVVDGDFQLSMIERVRRISSARIYAVFHQVPQVLAQLLTESSPRLLDGAVCVARCQIPLVQFMAPPGSTWFVPHGVDTDYFMPGELLSDEPSVLCVGCHWRDFTTLRESAELISRAVPAASVRLVAPRSLLPSGVNLAHVELVSEISDEQLLKEYQRAWVILLPLLDATANNSLLESMACGKPVVVSDVGGVRDYARPECAMLCPPGDARAHSAATIDLLLNSCRRESAGRGARAQAKLYAWPKIRAQIRQILDYRHESRSS